MNNDRIGKQRENRNSDTSYSQTSISSCFGNSDFQVTKRKKKTQTKKVSIFKCVVVFQSVEENICADEKGSKLILREKGEEAEGLSCIIVCDEDLAVGSEAKQQ